MRSKFADRQTDDELDRLLSKTLRAVEHTKVEVFQIAEDVRQELEDTRRTLETIREQTALEIQRVDTLQEEDRRARAKLLEISRSFESFTEAEIREHYERAQAIQAQLQVSIERERHLRQLRDAEERRLRRLQRQLERAETLCNQVDFALSVLSGRLDQLAAEDDGICIRQALAASIIRAQEAERRRLARDIHDGPAQLLAGVNLHLDYCRRLLDEDPVRTQQELAQLRSLVAKSLQDVRKIIFDLRPPTLDEHGLITAVRELIDDFEERVGLRCRLNVYGESPRLHKALEIAAYRIIQEALSNIWKHAGTDEALLTLAFDEGRLELEIADHGCGFDPSQLAERERSGEQFGLNNIRERVELLQGRFELMSAPGCGTSVRVELPLSLSSYEDEALQADEA